MPTPTFKVLSGLPSCGSAAETFTADGRRKASEGTVVEFFPGTPDSWVCNFVGGVYEPKEHFSGVCAHPDGERVLVFSCGTMFSVTPATRTVEVSEQSFVCSVLEWPEGNSVFLGKASEVTAIGSDGLLWTQQVGLDYAFVERISDGHLIVRYFDFEKDAWKKDCLNTENGKPIKRYPWQLPKKP